jgi:hypothetical protein
MATIVLIRERKFAGSALTTYCFADNELLAVLPNGTLSWTYLHEGRHKVWVAHGFGGNHTITADVVGGETYYFLPAEGLVPFSREMAQELLRGGLRVHIATDKERAKGASLVSKSKATLGSSRETVWLGGTGAATIRTTVGGSSCEVAITLQPNTPQDTSAFVKVPRRTRVLLENTGAITVRELNAGSTIPLVVAEDLEVDGKRVFRKGTPAEGVVAMATKAQRGGDAATLQVIVPHLVDGAGRRIPVWSFLVFGGLARLSSGTVLFKALGPINFLFVPGKDLELPPQSRFVVHFADDTWVKSAEGGP